MRLNYCQIEKSIVEKNPYFIWNPLVGERSPARLRFSDDL